MTLFLGSILTPTFNGDALLASESCKGMCAGAMGESMDLSGGPRAGSDLMIGQATLWAVHASTLPTRPPTIGAEMPDDAAGAPRFIDTREELNTGASRS